MREDESPIEQLQIANCKMKILNLKLEICILQSNLPHLCVQRHQWREKGNLPPAAVAISSPHDAEARYTNKRETTNAVVQPLSPFGSVTKFISPRPVMRTHLI
jgi:hypothetical protein